MLLVIAAWVYRWSFIPEPVPPEVQKSGLNIAGDILETVALSDLSKTKRGRRLINAAFRLFNEGRISFTSDLAKQAVLRGEGDAAVLYIQVMKVGEQYILPEHECTTECLFHETLHFIQNNSLQSIEEEVDAFYAAEQGRAAYLGIQPDFPLMRDGIPVEQWVRQNYPDLKSDPGYKPLE